MSTFYDRAIAREEGLATGQGEMKRPAGPSKEEENEEITKLRQQVERLKTLLLEKARKIIELEIYRGDYQHQALE